MLGGVGAGLRRGGFVRERNITNLGPSLSIFPIDDSTRGKSASRLSNTEIAGQSELSKDLHMLSSQGGRNFP